MPSVKTAITWTLLALAQLTTGHSVITNAVGDSGGSGMALGVDNTTPRDGTRRRPFQQDATRFRGDSAETVGETLGGGDNDVETGTSAILAETNDDLPQVTQGGELTMTLHQVNSDGAGPYTCMINDDGTGQSWTDITVTQNVEGNERGRNRDGEASDFPLVASIPADQECTGTVAGQNNVCLVRCQNPARAGPFGGVVPVQMAGGNAGGANNATDDTASNGADANNGAANNNAGNDSAATNDNAAVNNGAANNNAAANDDASANNGAVQNNAAVSNGASANDDDEEEEEDEEEDEEDDNGSLNNNRVRAIRFSA
ncbi:beta-1,3-glucanosyltransferase gas1 [Fusarium falciforme]